MNNFFMIKAVKVYGGSNRFKIIGLSDYQNVNMLWLNEQEVKRKIFELNPWIKKIQVEKEWPNSLVVIVEFEQSAAVLDIDNNQLILGDDGRVIEKIKKNKNNYLPKIIFYQKINFNAIATGDFLDFKEIEVSLKYLKKAKELGLTVNTIDIRGTYMIGLNLEEGKIFLSTEKNIEKQLMELETIIKHFKIQGQKFTKLDLRFNKPVVVF